MHMVTLVLVKNPFSPQDGREIRHIEAGGSLADLLEENRIEGVDLQATVNGTVWMKTQLSRMKISW